MKLPFPAFATTTASSLRFNLRTSKSAQAWAIGGGAQNDRRQVWPDGTETEAHFYNHIPAGRTGTTWLVQFLGDNLNVASKHEPLGVLDFGSQMPEISHMRRFNTLGMDASMNTFWQNKLASLQAPYAETNHTLGKCGLIEALAESDLADRSTLIILRRDLAKQCASYVSRNDFQNITVAWQWYLDISYPNIIVNPAILRPMGQIGWTLWYALEMEPRYAYYVLKFSDRINFVETRLEEATTPQGATRLLAALGHKAEPTLPPQTECRTAQQSGHRGADSRNPQSAQSDEVRSGRPGVGLHQVGKIAVRPGSAKRIGCLRQSDKRQSHRKRVCPPRDARG
ncbi:hypothetical protein AB9K35_20815 [Leisingera sp. XS_AS12]|uniref:hypothetical protein n=1 Tax=Leisingera sp. XS_AS12 TaxID=3241294 RepID=UPI0035133338